ncbi:universal stress protein [Noviherbaspirillum sp.]|uniref:universal stress protein n=1 Tax=Noviherbaspirillum sp. TaxID=1926288 RepID=UPI002B45B2B9|nr:universal stress protein [Noviherbaspirillum sp.]HJV80304.1 universal stress protein [Noviherbaspirillum sp.]HJW55210.1 universal stress protein [Burkholderiaceae bacterium]
MSKRIFAAIDDSSTSQKALDEAVRLAKALGAELCIATAIDEGPLMQHGMGIGTFVDIDKMKLEMRQASMALLEQAVASAAAAGCRAEHMLIEPDQRRIAEMIADAAGQWNADLVVVGTHGRRGFERMLVGSVAENLVRIATTSLMLVREK